MIYQELSVSLPTREMCAFLQDGFYNCGRDYRPAANMHMHSYSELHAVLEGHAVISVGGERYELCRGSMLLVPPRSLHSVTAREEGTRQTAFQISLDAQSPVLCRAEEYLLEDLFSEIVTVREHGDYTRLSAIIALLCCNFSKNATRVNRNVVDPAFLIQEFFSLHYSDAAYLSELSALLGVSERHAERLVREHTGMTFSEKLTDTRLTVADQLIRCGDMTLAEVAEYVGYRSYAGFWKAIKRRAARKSV